MFIPALWHPNEFESRDRACNSQAWFSGIYPWFIFGRWYDLYTGWAPVSLNRDRGESSDYQHLRFPSISLHPNYDKSVFSRFSRCPYYILASYEVKSSTSSAAQSYDRAKNQRLFPWFIWKWSCFRLPSLARHLGASLFERISSRWSIRKTLAPRAYRGARQLNPVLPIVELRPLDVLEPYHKSTWPIERPTRSTTRSNDYTWPYYWRIGRDC